MKSKMAATSEILNDCIGFLGLKIGVCHKNGVFICFSLEVIGKSIFAMAAILESKMAAARGRFRLGS